MKALRVGAAPEATPEKQLRPAQLGWGIRHRRGFQVLSTIAVIDSSTRTAFLTFLPFLLIAKGLPVETVGFALALVFGGGAAGKVLCGIGAARFGIIRTAVVTELITSIGILLLLVCRSAQRSRCFPLLGSP